MKAEETEETRGSPPTIGLITYWLENFEGLTKARQHTTIKYALHYLNEYQKEKKYYDIVMEAGKKSVFGTIEKLAEAAEKTLQNKETD